MAESRADASFRRFVRRVWRDDVAPLLRGPRADQRRKAASIGGTTAAASGALLDGMLGLKGKPFARAFTVLGARFGAMLPDIWDWNWLRRHADNEQRELIAEQLRRRAAQLADREAAELFDLTPQSTRAELQHAWRATSLRWHPDKAPSEDRRHEYQIRFVAYQAAYQRLLDAYDAGRLPTSARGENQPADFE